LPHDDSKALRSRTPIIAQSLLAIVCEFIFLRNTC
jgi:hypothetical protein